MIRYDWHTVTRLLLTSRTLDTIEEEELVPAGEIAYQFSAGGHELAQILLGLALNHPHDGATVYYRSRPFMLATGLSVRTALVSSMARATGISSGRDTGVVYNKPGAGNVTVLPMSGDVGTQYTPAAGWAQSIQYHSKELGHGEWHGALSVAMGGDGSVASNGFWSALTIATTLKLPMLFFIEDNGYAISVESHLQTPSGNIAENLQSFKNLTTLSGDGTDPADAGANINMAVEMVRNGGGPVLLRLTVPRLPGHSYSDNQAYKSEEEREQERARDPLRTLKEFMVPERMSALEWEQLSNEVRADVESARDAALDTPHPDVSTATTHVFFEGDPQQQGGLLPENALPAPGLEETEIEEPIRINLIDAVRQTLQAEMRRNPRILVFGEDVGVKGGVHGATRGMQSEFGEARVFDTSLSEEGIIGRSSGMAIAGLLPVPEIQFRKYMDPATEQINDVGTIRWRTGNRFAAPMVVRIPFGFSKTVGDPWHSVSDESVLAHKPGWKIAIPSNAQDAVGLLRTALRGNDPVIFLEHRNLLDTAQARRPYPGDNYALPFGKANVVQDGSDLTVVTWGAMVHRCQQATGAFPGKVEIIDLRTIVPWDEETVLQSVKKTARCLVVHEDCGTAGFGSEVASTVAQEVFMWLDAPVERLTGADCPVPYSKELMPAIVPTVERIRAKMEHILTF